MRMTMNMGLAAMALMAGAAVGQEPVRTPRKATIRNQSKPVPQSAGDNRPGETNRQFAARMRAEQARQAQAETESEND